jgi:glycosyltransferase involved in cell wall biosynthesis
MSLLTSLQPPALSHLSPRARRPRAAQTPEVTIAIPSYDRPDLLRNALASVANLRGKTRYEVLICDDGGLAETRRVVRESGLPNVRFIPRERQLGAIANWNRCIAHARAEWVTILHEDDLLYPWFLELVAPRLGLGAVAVAVRCVQGAIAPALAAPPFRPSIVDYRPAWFLKSSMTPFPGVVFSRSVARQLGGFDAAEHAIADYAFWYALACAGRVEVIQAGAAFYRVSAGQWTDRAWPEMLRRAHVLRLRIAQEQFPTHPKFGRWLARFFSARMARSYARRYESAPATLRRVQRFNRMPLSGAPSGWVWAALRRAGGRIHESPASRETDLALGEPIRTRQ